MGEAHASAALMHFEILSQAFHQSMKKMFCIGSLSKFQDSARVIGRQLQQLPTRQQKISEHHSNLQTLAEIAVYGSPLFAQYPVHTIYVMGCLLYE